MKAFKTRLIAVAVASSMTAAYADEICKVSHLANGSLGTCDSPNAKVKTPQTNGASPLLKVSAKHSNALHLLKISTQGKTTSSKGSGQVMKNIVFNTLPTTLEDFKALPQMALTDPYSAPALFIVAMTNYARDKNLALEMINAIKGPKQLSNYEIGFIKDRMAGKDYLPNSYFKGASPENAYTPSLPYTVTVSENPYTYQNDGYAKVFIKSGGADSARPFIVRQKGNQWFMWDQMLLGDIRPPKGADGW